MTLKTFLGLTLSVVLAACSRSGSKGLAVRARASATQTTATNTATGLDLQNGIVLTRVRIVVRAVEVEGGETAGKGTCSAPTTPATGSATTTGTSGSVADTSADDPECENELAFGPFLVDLQGAELTGGVHPQFNVDVPAATYEELKFKIGLVTADQAAAAPVAGQQAGLAELAGLGASIAIDGTVDGVAFPTFTAALSAKQERDGSVTVTADKAVSLTLDVDANGWFGGTGTARLDPTAANQAAIVANIQASIRLVHDEDEDGKDDELDPAGHG
jgi:hypothetical protein